MGVGKAQRDRIIKTLRRIVSKEGVLTSPADLMLYEFDSSLGRARPEVVVLPTSREQVVEVVRLANREGVPFVARGAGTGLSGGSLPVRGGLVISLARLNRILEIDLPNRTAVVEPGVVNLELNSALSRHGYWFAPDPASQRACTIGGNVGENAGGPHCLKYGVTTNHVLGLEVILPDGQVVQAGGKAPDWPGYDLVGLLVGSEGTLGIVTRITVRISPRPESLRTMLAAFATIEQASNAVSAIIAAGILPATLEMMDRLVLQAVEDSFQAGYPRDAGALLLMEVDGLAEGLDRQAQRVAELCRQQGAQEVRLAQSEEERERLWMGRRGAPIAINRISPYYILADGTVPRTRLPEVLRRVAEIGQRYSFPIGNLFHAGDGNLHPLVFFDGTIPGERERALQASHEILKACTEVGGTISGEHGIGMEKALAMELVFDQGDLSLMEGIKAALDPRGLCNPGKVFPSSHGHES